MRTFRQVVLVIFLSISTASFFGLDSAAWGRQQEFLSDEISADGFAESRDAIGANQFDPLVLAASADPWVARSLVQVGASGSVVALGSMRVLHRSAEIPGPWASAAAVVSLPDQSLASVRFTTARSGAVVEFVGTEGNASVAMVNIVERKFWMDSLPSGSNPIAVCSVIEPVMVRSSVAAIEPVFIGLTVDLSRLDDFRRDSFALIGPCVGMEQCIRLAVIDYDAQVAVCKNNVLSDFLAACWAGGAVGGAGGGIGGAILLPGIGGVPGGLLGALWGCLVAGNLQATAAIQKCIANADTELHRRLKLCQENNPECMIVIVGIE